MHLPWKISMVNFNNVCQLEINPNQPKITMKTTKHAGVLVVSCCCCCCCCCCCWWCYWEQFWLIVCRTTRMLSFRVDWKSGGFAPTQSVWQVKEPQLGWKYRITEILRRLYSLAGWLADIFEEHTGAAVQTKCIANDRTRWSRMRPIIGWCKISCSTQKKNERRNEAISHLVLLAFAVKCMWFITDELFLNEIFLCIFVVCAAFFLFLLSLAKFLR